MAQHNVGAQWISAGRDVSLMPRSGVQVASTPLIARACVLGTCMMVVSVMCGLLYLLKLVLVKGRISLAVKVAKARAGES